MNLVYVFKDPLPLKSAPGIQAIHTCHALAEAGVSVNLLHEDSSLPTEAILAYHGLEKPRNLNLIPVPGRRLLLFRSNTVFNCSALAEIKRLKRPDVIYCRQMKQADFLASNLPGVPLIYEAHDLFSPLYVEEHGRKNAELDALERSALKNSRGIVSVSKGLKAEIAKIAPGKPLVTIPNGAICRGGVQNKDLRSDDPEIIYSGELHPQKGAELLIQALRHLDSPRVTVIGGNEQRIEALKAHAEGLGLKRISFTGYLGHQAVQERLAQAQIAVLPNRRTLRSVRYTSPMKLFEYMAARLAIVASDLPTVREIVSDGEVLFVKPDDAKELAAGLKCLIDDPDLREQLADRAFGRAKDCTWEKRAERIIQFIIDDVLGNHTRIATDVEEELVAVPG